MMITMAFLISSSVPRDCLIIPARMRMVTEPLTSRKPIVIMMASSMRSKSVVMEPTRLIRMATVHRTTGIPTVITTVSMMRLKVLLIPMVMASRTMSMLVLVETVIVMVSRILLNVLSIRVVRIQTVTVHLIISILIRITTA